MLLLSLVGMQAQTTECGNKYTEVCATFDTTFTEHNPPVPINLDDLFASEIGGKIAIEVGSWASSLGWTVLTFSPLFSIAAPGMIVHLGTAAGSMIGVSKAFSYHINNWGPYVKYGRSKQNKSISQGVSLSVDVIKVPRRSSRFISIAADMRLVPNDEFEGGHKIIRSKYMDKYIFKIAPKDPSKVELQKSIPLSQNKSASYSESFSIDASGSVQWGSPSASAGMGYSMSTTKNIADFELKFEEKDGKRTDWEYSMGNSYEGGGPREYSNAQDLIINGVFTKWLEEPANLAKSTNQIKFANIYRIDPNESGPIEFEFQSIQQIMHVEIVGRWGIPGAELSGVSVIVPSYYVVEGKIIVTPDPNNPSNTKITKEMTGKVYTYQQFMDKSQAPLPTVVPSITPGCYAIKNMHSKQYINPGAGSAVVNYYANSDNLTAGEKINVVYRGKKGDPERDVYALYSSDQRYISEPPGDAIFKAAHVNFGELWSFEPKSGEAGTYFIKSLNQGKYLSANNNWFQQLGTSFHPNAWEEWSLVPQSGCLNSPYESFEHSREGTEVSAKIMSGSSGSSTFGINVMPDAISNTLLDFKGKIYPSAQNDLIDQNYTENITEFTLEAWINNDNVGNDIQAIVSSDGPQFVHMQTSASTINNAVYFEDGSSMMLPQIPKLSAGWHHVAISAKSGDSKIYIDSEQYGNTIAQQFGKLKSSSNFRVGQGWQGGRKFIGKIANVRLWDKSKSKAEITASMNNHASISHPNLIYQSSNILERSFASLEECAQVPSTVTSGISKVTIEGWINNQESDYVEIQSIVSSTQGDFVHFQTSSNTNTSNVAYLSNGENIMLPCIPKLNTGWHHVAIVVESGNYRVLVDGVQVGSANSTTFSGLKDSNSTFIGKGWQGDRLFKGKMSNMRIWKNIAMSNADIISQSQAPPM